MKSKRILSALLIGVMCFSMALSAFGADKDVATMSFINDDEAVLSIDHEQIAIKAYDDMELNQADIQDFYQRMQVVKAEEMPSSLTRSAESVDCFEYTLMTDDATYFYEESSDGENKNLYVFDTQLTEVEAGDEEQVNEIQPRASLPDGIGGRLNLNTSYGNYISGTIETPLKSQISGVNNTSIYNYIYTGFSGQTTSGGNIESDLGLQYSTKESIGGWNHYFLLDIAGKKYTVDDPRSDYPDVTDNNFFLTSDSSNTRNITFATYKNFNNTGYVRSKMQGYARYNNAGGTGTPGAYNKISVKEYYKPVAGISKWKLLNTITSETASNLKSWCKITNVTLDGTAPSQSYITKDEDYATVTPTYSNSRLSTLTINVSK
ncbi:MAG: YrpD family protein [Desulfitobacteriaceae bacterium]|nr:YrpD family protein [Desulfitobacteriaceae bacterium]